MGGSCYQAYGLTIHSDLTCPDLIDATAVPDAWFRAGEVAARLPNAVGQGICYETAPGVALVRVDGIARFLIRDGREIVYERAEGADDDSVRLFLLGIGLGLLLQQRGNFVLHATTVSRDGQAIALAGPSGAGKSTLATALVKRGFSLVADEASCLSLDGDVPTVVPGTPNLLLWRHALDGFQDDASAFRRVRPQLEKFIVPQRMRFAGEPQRLTRLVLLTFDSRHTLSFERLSGLERFRAFIEQTFRAEYHAGLGLLRQRQLHCSRIVPHVAVDRLAWTQQWPDLDAAATHIDRLVASTPIGDSTVARPSSLSS